MSAQGLLNVTVRTDLIELGNGVATTPAVWGTFVSHLGTGHCVLAYRMDPGSASKLYCGAIQARQDGLILEGYN